MELLLFIGGLVLLVLGAEALVRGASRLAVAFRVPPLVVGLLVVGYGTSMPEMGVSVEAALSGQAEVALGNVVGSNIFNVLFILGISALIAPLAVGSRLVRLDVPIMIGLSALLLLLALDGQVGRIDGLLLLAGLVAYTIFTAVKGRAEARASQPASSMRAWALAFHALLIGIGLACLVFGAGLLVDGATRVADVLGISPLVIGVLVVAGGTSLPELMTSVVATVRGNRDIAVGNVVGSNIFNILGVQGAASALAGVPVGEQSLLLDLPVMIAVAVACLPLFATGHLIARWEGGFFLAMFGGYAAYLLLSALRPGLVFGHGVAGAILVSVIAAVTMGIVGHRAWRAWRSSSRLRSER